MEDSTEHQKYTIIKIADSFGVSFQYLSTEFIKSSLTVRESIKATEELSEMMKLANNELKYRKVEVSRTNPNTRRYNKRKF